jgi:uncharacterized protein YraI
MANGSSDHPLSKIFWLILIPTVIGLFILLVEYGFFVPWTSPTPTPQISNTPELQPEPATPIEVPTSPVTAASTTPSINFLIDAVVKTDKINLRDGPGRAYRSLSVYSQGTALRIIGKEKTKEWLQVQTPDGQIGWMFSELLQVNIALTDIALVAAAPTVQVVSSGNNAPTQPPQQRPTKLPVTVTVQPPTPQPRPTPAPVLLVTRADFLELYDATYNEQGWCGLWNMLVEHKRVSGNCPQNVLQLTHDTISSGSVLDGAQIEIASDIVVYSPACVTFDPSDTPYSGGDFGYKHANDSLATNITMKANGLFTFYFYCG